MCGRVPVGRVSWPAMSGKKKDKRVHACLIINQRSEDRTFDLNQALPVLTAQGWDVEVREKHAKGDAAAIARQMAEKGFDPIVNCGGDGTMNEIVDALAGSDTAVGVIPGGTANVWPQQIGVSDRSRVAATQLVASDRLRMDVGRLEIDGKHRHHFLMMAGMGADGAIMQRASRSLKNRIGALAVGVAAVEAIPAMKTVPLQIEMDGVQWSGDLSELIIGNTRNYGGFTRITGDAYVDDGLLDVCLFTTGNAIETARQLASLLVHKHPSESSSETYRAANIVVHASEPIPLQVDGSDLEISETGKVTYTFSVVPHGLTVLVPRTYDGGMFEHGMDASPFNGHGKHKGKKG